MSNRQKKEYILVFIAEFFALLCAVASSVFVFGVIHKKIILHSFSTSDYNLFLLILIISFVLVFINFEQIKGIYERTLNQQIKHTVKMELLFSGCVTILMYVSKSALLDSRYMLTGIIIFQVIYSIIANRIIKYLLHKISKSNSLVSLVGLISVSDRVEQLIDIINEDWSKNISGIALLDAEEKDIGTKIKGITVRAGYGDFIEWIKQDAVDEVYIDIPYESGSSMTQYIYELTSMGTDIHINIPFLDNLYSRKDMPKLYSNIDNYNNTSMLSLSVGKLSIRGIIIKRIIDIIGSIVGLIISVPIIAITAIPLKLESPGPLFFKQQRVGLNGRYFYIYKLRSMYIDAEERKKELMAKNEMKGLMFKMTDDPRITKVGKFIRKTSIDELPQFLNVLKGEMSLVGTRPPTVDEYKQYETHHKRRLSMKPGITGLWQVSGRSSIEDFEDIIKLDVQYIDNWTIWQDIKILLKTVKVVFAGRGAK